MKFSKYVRLTMASAMMLGISAVADAAFYDLGTTTLPAIGGNGNASPGPSVTDGDQISLKGVWDGSGATSLADSTNWYFTTLIPNLFLDQATIVHNGFTTLSAELFSPTSVLLYTFTPGVTANLIPLAIVGTYRILVTQDLIHGNGHSYTFDARIVPLPAAAWLLLSGVAGLGALARRRKVAVEG